MTKNRIAERTRLKAQLEAEPFEWDVDDPAYAPLKAALDYLKLDDYEIVYSRYALGSYADYEPGLVVIPRHYQRLPIAQQIGSIIHELVHIKMRHLLETIDDRYLDREDRLELLNNFPTTAHAYQHILHYTLQDEMLLKAKLACEIMADEIALHFVGKDSYIAKLLWLHQQLGDARDLDITSMSLKEQWGALHALFSEKAAFAKTQQENIQIDFSHAFSCSAFKSSPETTEENNFIINKYPFVDDAYNNLIKFPDYLLLRLENIRRFNPESYQLPAIQ